MSSEPKRGAAPNAAAAPRLVPILVLGTFSILCTETGVIGVLPLLAELYSIDLATAGSS